MTARLTMDRRALLAGAGALAAALTLDRAGAAAQDVVRRPGAFPPGFLWGAATAGHQVEGNNTASDLWLLEHTTPTVFAEPSGDADNSFALWATDLDLARALGLNTYRFSLEWARIEPEPGAFSRAMLDHYKAVVDGCRPRGLTPVVTFNHFTAPRWFAARGGFTNREAPDLFARFCDRAARHLAGNVGYALTFNEPNILRLLRGLLPPQLLDAQRAMLAAAARAAGTPKFVAANAATPEDVEAMLPIMVAAHKAGRAAIKAARGDLPVGVSLAMTDDEAAGPNSLRDAKRAEVYGAWLEAARGDDFLGVQNYERVRWDANGRLPAPAGAVRNWSGAEVYAPSLAGAVRYAHQATGVPILVTEHGVGTDDDAIRAALIPAALAELRKAMDDGVPVKGYVHWSLLDNYEWVFGFRPKFGLCSVDRTTFARTPKPSAAVLGAIARRNAV
ncbi:beta-glucosidase [Gemmatimonadetes bacterium T265]|nr:beta-glucosidase [Gemmatimonadetes bacterium T265]